MCSNIAWFHCFYFGCSRLIFLLFAVGYSLVAKNLRKSKVYFYYSKKIEYENIMACCRSQPFVWPIHSMKFAEIRRLLAANAKIFRCIALQRSGNQFNETQNKLSSFWFYLLYEVDKHSSSISWQPRKKQQQQQLKLRNAIRPIR